MSDSDLEAANRALLSAIEAAPPDPALERRLDRVAEATWDVAHSSGRRPDPARIRHIDCTLAGLARTADWEKRWRIEQARARLWRYATALEAV